MRLSFPPLRELPSVHAALAWLLADGEKADIDILAAARASGLILSDDGPHWKADADIVTRLAETSLKRLPGDLDLVKVLHRPRLLSDNGPSYLSSELGEWLENKGIRHIRGRAYHPMTQGKIERYHRSMKNRILLENYYLPGQLEQSIGEFVEYYNNCRYHESLDNLTPADVYFGRGPAILKRRETIKRKTIEQRRRLHQQAIAA